MTLYDTNVANHSGNVFGGTLNPPQLWMGCDQAVPNVTFYFYYIGDNILEFLEMVQKSHNCSERLLRNHMTLNVTSPVWNLRSQRI